MSNPFASERPPGDAGPRVVARSSIRDDRSRVLKDGDTFAVFDHLGDAKRGGLDEEGVYHLGTRHVSELLLHVDGDRAFFLTSNVSSEDGRLSVALTNHDRVLAGQLLTALGTLEVAITKLLHDAVLYQCFKLKNHGRNPLDTELVLHFAADFADIFQVRGIPRKARGKDLAPEVRERDVTLGYRGLDELVRRTRLHFEPAPTALSDARALFRVRLPPGAEVELFSTIACDLEEDRASTFEFPRATERAQEERRASVVHRSPIETSNSQVNAWIARATSDLQMMTTELGTGPFPYAGVPWFNAPFGRDAIVTALECLWWAPRLAAGVLRFLASTQARELVPEADAEPGKIVHEMRSGEMAGLKEVPFGRYYGSIDGTPLFVILLHAYYRRCGDRALVEELWPNAEAALDWLDRYGDRDGDGFLEYQRRTPQGLVHQAWKDSDDAVFHRDGGAAEGPFALCEVQAYAYAARRAGAELAQLFGRGELARKLAASAEQLRRRFNGAFWCEELGTYAIALDGAKRPCRIRASNAGQCLFSGIIPGRRAQRLARALLAPESFSGWGIRTVAAGEARYNPMGYHTGSVWPHDNALIALGFSRFGWTDLALTLFAAQFEAGMYFDLYRMPELFCGFAREASAGPVLYPVACSPQAWSAGAVFLLTQACLGLQIDAPRHVLRFHRPSLPRGIDWMKLSGITIGQASVDVMLERHENDVGVNVLRRDGPLRTVVEK